MKKILVLFLLCALKNIILGQSIAFNLLNKTIGKLEPIEIKLTLTNADTIRKKNFVPFGDFANPLVEYKSVWTNKWHYLVGEERYIPGLGLRDYMREGVLRAKTTKVYFKGFIATDNNIVLGSTYQLKSGRYHLRLKYKLNDSIFLYSNKQTLVVLKYKGEDKKIYDVLSKLKMPHFIFETVYDYTEGTDIPIQTNAYINKKVPNNIKIAEKILREHPNSRFTLWAKLHIIGHNLYKASEISRNKTQGDISTLLSDSETMLKTIEKDAEKDEFIAYCVAKIKKKIQIEKDKLSKN